MLSLVTAAELQYHFDADSRDREIARIRSIREREVSIAARQAELARVASAPRARAPWARPIGLQPATACAC